MVSSLAPIRSLSIVLPAHNEQDTLEHALLMTIKGLQELGYDAQIIISENGSTDNTAALATELVQTYPQAQLITSPRPDYGAALRLGFEAATGDVVVNFDVDYVDMKFVADALRLIEQPGGPSVVVASKRNVEALDQRPIGRRVVTWTFTTLLRFGFGMKVSDTHGIKMINKADLMPIVQQCRFGVDLFDTEMVIRAEKAGLVVAELPATVRDTRPPRSSILRRIPRSIWGLAKLRALLWNEDIHRLVSGSHTPTRKLPR